MFQGLLPNGIFRRDTLLCWDGGTADRFDKTALTYTSTTSSVKIHDATAHIFNGTSSKIDYGSERVGDGNITMVAWINQNTFGEGSAGRIVDNGKFWVRANSTSFRISVSSDGSTEANSATSSLLNDHEVFVAVTRTSAGVANIYINGVLSGTANQASGTPAAGSTNLIIGNNNAASATFDGRISGVCIFNKILTTTQIGQLYNEELPSIPSPIPSTELVPHWYDGERVGNFDNSANWQELSGGTTPKLAANALWSWIQADSPANMIGGVLNSNPLTKFVLTLTGQTAMVDLEDITSATVNGVNYLYGMDMGNNGNGVDSRGAGIDIRIFRIVEPTITGSDIATTNFIEINCAFPTVGGPTLRDAEASFVDENGRIWIIIKRDATPQRVYSLPHATSYSGTQTLIYEGDMTAIAESRTTPLTTTPCFAVSAAISPNGKEILVKNYMTVYYFPRDPARETVMQALQKPLVTVPAYPGGGTFPAPKTSHPNQEPQGEAIWYSPDGRDLYTCSEYLSTEGSGATTYPLFKYKRSAAVPTTVSFQDGVSPTAAYAGTLDTYIWDTNPDTAYGTETTFVVDTAPGVESDQRKGLVSFDLSSIPTTAVVIGAQLDLYISTEGQGFKFHKMLISWGEASTYNSLGGPVDNDGIKAAVASDCQNGINLDGVTGNTRNNMRLDTVQGWVTNPATNFGWLVEMISSATGDGIQFDSRQGLTAAQRPKLTLRYYIP